MPHLSPSDRPLFVRPMRWLASALVLCASVAQAAAPTGLLNDTGQTLCANLSNTAMVTCDSITTGDASAQPRQDGRFGRDPAAPAKVGGGAAGFDFTKICMDGTPNCATAPDTGASPASTAWACTRDNVTNLIWSLQTQGEISWDAAQALSDNRCGFATGWRLPSRRELLNIVHAGGGHPAIDSSYFPATISYHYWSCESFAPNLAKAWMVDFWFGSIGNAYKSDTIHRYVRLVRSDEPSPVAPPGSGFANLANMSRGDEQGGAPILPVDAGGVTDPLNRVIVYSATGLPYGLSINSATGLISGTYDAIGNEAFTVTVTAALAGSCIRMTKTFVLTIIDQG